MNLKLKEEFLISFNKGWKHYFSFVGFSLKEAIKNKIAFIYYGVSKCPENLVGIVQVLDKCLL